ncbi:MAG: ABC transporter substrate-binding protein [Anaerolineae bacterium]|nr:ABC transporter substrate-binding protein [Anaerolineae bacterium]
MKSLKRFAVWQRETRCSTGTCWRVSHILLAYLILALALTVSGCQKSPTTTTQADTLVFMAGYKPQANLPFVGVYVAQEKGYFADEALTVTIQHSAGRGEHLQLLAAGKVDVTTQDAAILLQRRADPGLPLLSIALVGQHGQQAYVALADSGIVSLQDWRGRSIGYKGTPPPDLPALLDIAGLSAEDVSLINVGFDPRVLVEGLVEIYPVYNSNEPYLLRSWGYELQEWQVSDYGVPTLGLAYVSTPEIVERDPERMERFVRAALRGITYAAAHLDEAVEIVMLYAGEEADPEHMRFMLDTELRDAQVEGQAIGWQTAEQWQALADSLLQYQALSAPVDVSAAFTNRFVEAAGE